MFVVLYRDDTNETNEILGVFNRIENARSCMERKRVGLIRELGAKFDSVDGFNDPNSFGVNYDGAYYDSCEIVEVDGPKD